MTNRHSIIAEFYRREESVPFDWNGRDCLHFCGDLALAITGSDPIEKYRGTYASEQEAMRRMVEHGCKSLGDCAALAYPEIPPALAQTGDWAFVEGNDKQLPVLGVVVADKIISRTLTGVGYVGRTLASRAFKVG